MGNIFSPMSFIKNYTYEKYNWLDSVNLCLFTTIFLYVHTVCPNGSCQLSRCCKACK